MKTIVAALVSGVLLAALPAAAPAKPAPAKRAAPAARQWDRTVTMTRQGFPVLGNPAAPVKVVQFVSFTCHHCAVFSQESLAPLNSGLVHEGKVSLEMRPYLRNGTDIIPSLLALCGDKSRFFGNESALFAAQEAWFKAPADPGYAARWQKLEANPGAQRRVVAQDLGLYKLMLARGYTARALDACLADEAKVKWLMDQTNYASDTIGVTGTPSFLINGALQDIYDWANLRTRIDSALAGQPVVAAPVIFDPTKP